MEKLDEQGRIHEIVDPNERFQEIAKAYARQPEGTLVVSPDNQSRTKINQVSIEKCKPEVKWNTGKKD